MNAPSPDTAWFYVSIVDGKRRALLAGPYASHTDALGQVDRVRGMADQVDPRAAFYAFGTAGSATRHATRFGVV